MTSNEQKRILTPDMFALTDQGEVVIRDQDLAEKLKGYGRSEASDERGVWIGVVITA